MKYQHFLFKQIMFLVSVTIMAALSSQVIAHNQHPSMMHPDHMGMGHMGMGHMGMGHMGMAFNDFYMLDLTPTQRSRLRDIHKQLRTEISKFQDQIFELDDQLYEQYKKDKPDPRTIGDTYQKIFNVNRQIIELHIKTRNQQYDILTKEQQDKLKEWQDNWSGYKYNNMPFRGMHNMMH